MSSASSQVGISRRQAHVTVSMVTSATRMVLFMSTGKFHPVSGLILLPSLPPSCSKARMKSLPMFNPFLRCAWLQSDLGVWEAAACLVCEGGGKVVTDTIYRAHHLSQAL